DPLIPSFFAQPFIQISEMDFRIVPAKLTNVRLEPIRIEPAEHLIKLLPQHQTNHRHRKLLKFYRFPKHAAKNCSSLRVRKLATRNLQIQTDEIIGPIKGKSSERSNVIRSNRLIGLVCADWIHKLPFQNSDFDLLNIVVFHESGWSKHRCRQSELADVLLDFPFAFPVIDARIPLGATNRRIDEMFYPGSSRCVGQVFPLLDFPYCA